MSYLEIKGYGPNRAMPLPPAAMCRARDLFGTTSFCGVYFGWRASSCFYVGKSRDIPLRLSSHDKISPDDGISYIQFDHDQIAANELFYIWLLRPSENSETKPVPAHSAAMKMPSRIGSLSVEIVKTAVTSDLQLLLRVIDGEWLRCGLLQWTLTRPEIGKFAQMLEIGRLETSDQLLGRKILLTNVRLTGDRIDNCKARPFSAPLTL